MFESAKMALKAAGAKAGDLRSKSSVFSAKFAEENFISRRRAYAQATNLSRAGGGRRKP